jgi:hypothetical protein
VEQPLLGHRPAIARTMKGKIIEVYIWMLSLPRPPSIGRCIKTTLVPAGPSVHLICKNSLTKSSGGSPLILLAGYMSCHFFPPSLLAAKYPLELLNQPKVGLRKKIQAGSIVG